MAGRNVVFWLAGRNVVFSLVGRNVAFWLVGRNMVWPKRGLAETWFGRNVGQRFSNINQRLSVCHFSILILAICIRFDADCERAYAFLWLRGLRPLGVAGIFFKVFGKMNRGSFLNFFLTWHLRRGAIAGCPSVLIYPKCSDLEGPNLIK